MSQRVACPGCRATLPVPEQFLGKQVRCGKCDCTFVAEPPAPPEAPEPSKGPGPQEEELLTVLPAENPRPPHLARSGREEWPGAVSEGQLRRPRVQRGAQYDPFPPRPWLRIVLLIIALVVGVPVLCFFGPQVLFVILWFNGVPRGTSVGPKPVT